MTNDSTNNEKRLSYFISDLHLGAAYISDSKEHQRRIAAWLEKITPTAKNLFLLGDVMDYWYEYREVAPRGYVRFLGALARIADSGTNIVWLRGNHDIWFFDYINNEIGLEIKENVTTTLDGKIFYLAHGDGEGAISRGYSFMRKMFRNRFCQWLYGAIHPRWTIAFAHNWSTHSRKQSKECNPVIVTKELGRLKDWAESENLTRTEEGQPKIDYFVFGHLHCPMRASISDDNSELIVLGEAFRQMCYGVWDGNKFELRTMERG